MADIPVPFPIGTNPGKNRAETGGRIINGVSEALADDAENRFVIRRLPGLTAFGNSGQTGYRGAMLAGATLYAAFSGELVKFDDDGTVTNLSNLDGTQPVSFARNNLLPTFQTVCVTEQGAFTVNPTTGAATLSDADLPQPTDVCFGDGYFFFGIADGRIFASGINATTVSALDFTTCDTNPDQLLRVIWFGGRLMGWGPDSCEIFYNAANPTGFPFRREAVVKGPGLGAKWGITGHEPGWGKGLFWIGSDNGVHTLPGGYAAVRISTPDIDRLIEAVADKSTIRAHCYIEGGHAFVEFSCPAWTRTFDVTTQQWDEGKSYQHNCRRMIGPSVFAFNKWLVGDRLSGNLIEPDWNNNRDIDQPLVVEVWSGKCKIGYGQRTALRLQFVKGVGSIAGLDPIERDPSIEISWSDDGGNVFSNPIIRKLGRAGRRMQVIELSPNVCGACRGYEGRIWKVRMSDPREFALLGGVMAVT